MTPPPTPVNICPKSCNFLVKVGKLLFWGTSMSTVVPMYCAETLLQFSAILVEGLIFSPLITYIYYYSKVRAFRPMGCTSPPCPVETPVSRLPPPLGFGAPHDGDVRAARASFAGVFRCVSVCFCVSLCLFLFMLD